MEATQLPSQATDAGGCFQAASKAASKSKATDASPFRRKETKTVVAPWVLKAQKREAKAAAVIKAASKAKAMFQEGATSKVGATASSSSAEIGGPKSKGDAGRRLAPQPPSAPPPGWHAGFNAGMRAEAGMQASSDVEWESAKESKNRSTC